MARNFIASHGLVGVVLRTAENQGPSNARNVGWHAASSEWIQFLDADDLLAPNKLERQLSVALSAPDHVAVLYSPWQRLSAANDDWEPGGPIIRSRVDDDPVTNILKDVSFGYVGPTLIRRRVLEQVGGFQPEMKISEDLDLMLRIAMAGYSFRSVESAEPLFFYRDTPGSLWRRTRFDCDAAMRSCLTIRAADLYLRERDGHRMPVATRRAIARRYFRWLKTHRSCDASNFNLVISWIYELRLRSVPPGTPFPIRAIAPIVGLGSALRGAFALRGLLVTGSRRSSPPSRRPSIPSGPRS